MDKRKRNNVFIVLEGLSGSGKTTIGKIVAKKIRGKFYRTPPSLFTGSFRNCIDKCVSSSARFLFYLAGVIQASDEISRILADQPIVCDRYLLTTLCYHRALGIQINISDSVFRPLSQPDFTFLIVCKKAIRLKRLHDRGLSFNDRQERQIKIEQRFLMQYRKYNLIEVDNSSDNPEVAAERIIAFLRE